MRIGIDASRATLAQRSGVEGYSLHIIRGLLALGHDHQFILYFRDEPPPGLFEITENVNVRVLKSRRLWTHYAFRKAILADQPDVLFVPGHVIPWPDTGRTPAVVTIHDLGYKHFPDKHPFFERSYLEISTRHSARQARAIIVHSQATAQDLVSLEHIGRGKIHVVNAGVDDLFQPVLDRDLLHATLGKYQIEQPYILHVGRMEPRKNLARLVQAFSLLVEDQPEYSLVFTGRYNQRYRAFNEAVNQLTEPGRVRLTGYVPDADLPALYSGAALYIFPSLYEGFGFPSLEAMACGTPVICSNTSSLPELVADAALTVAPTDVNAIANALRRLLSDDSLREELRRKGFSQAKKFTWEECSGETLKVLLEVARKQRSKG